MTKFLRRTWNRYNKLGKRRKKKRAWRRPAGRDNKMREKRRGYPKVVSIGYKSEKKIRVQIKGKNPLIIKNIKDLIGIRKNQIAVLGKVGKKKKIEIVKRAKEMKIELANIKTNKFLEEIEHLKKEEPGKAKERIDKEKNESQKEKRTS